MESIINLSFGVMFLIFSVVGGIIGGIRGYSIAKKDLLNKSLRKYIIVSDKDYIKGEMGSRIVLGILCGILLCVIVMIILAFGVDLYRCIEILR